MNEVIYDYSELRVRIFQKFGTVSAFARAMGMKPSLISMRLHNKTYWNQLDIDKSCSLLDISNPKDFFFVRKEFD